MFLIVKRFLIFLVRELPICLILIGVSFWVFLKYDNLAFRDRVIDEAKRLASINFDSRDIDDIEYKITIDIHGVTVIVWITLDDKFVNGFSGECLESNLEYTANPSVNSITQLSDYPNTTDYIDIKMPICEGHYGYPDSDSDGGLSVFNQKSMLIIEMYSG